MKLTQILLATSISFSALFLSKVPAHAGQTIIDNPTVGGYGLDYCREWTTNCGMPAATAYCQSMGHRYAVDFQWVKDNQVTRVINGGQVCDAGFCDRITQVTCRE